MGQRDEQPDNFAADPPQAAEALVRSMTQDLEHLRQTIVGELSQDVKRLQHEKSQLLEDIETLKAQRQQQLVQQQKIVRQIAPALGNQIQALVMKRLQQLADASPGTAQAVIPPSGPDDQFVKAVQDNENAYRLIASLDATLRATFRTLQQDLSSYQSALSQQLGQMYSLEQQGEAILEALVSRLREKIQAESAAPEPPPPAPPSGRDRPSPPPSTPDKPGYSGDSQATLLVSEPARQPVAAPLVPEPPPFVFQPPAKPQKASKHPIGFILVLLSFLALAFENVVVTLIFNRSPIFGLDEVGGFIAPSVTSALLLLWLRMLVVVPLAAILATFFYPAVWRDLRQFAQLKDWSLILRVLGSGFFLFLSQVLIYLALGTLSPGVAVTIFFIYPIVTVFLTWGLFGERLNRVKTLIIGSVLLGVILSSLGSDGGGVRAAVGAGVALALHIILTLTCARTLNPVPFMWLNFVTGFVFSGLSLAVLPSPEVGRLASGPNLWLSVVLGGLLLGSTALVSYLLNNIGIRLVRAERASILQAIVPVLTALLAFAIIGREMQPPQILGMLLVTLGIAALSFERSRRPPQAPMRK